MKAIAGSTSLIVVPDDYPTIQSAIDAALDGSTILVRSGIYFESLQITKCLEIYGSEESPTVLKNPSGGDVVYIQANYATFAGFHIEGSAESFGAGIYMSQSQHVQILGNVIFGNRYGIYIWDSFDIILRNNNMTNNRFGFGVWGLFLQHFLHDIDVSNFVNEKPMYYWVNGKNKTVPSDAGYVALVNSTDVTVRDLTPARNFQGIFVAHSISIKIQNVTSVSNHYGLHILASNDSVIARSNITLNDVGLLLDLSCNNDIVENNFSNNSVGIQFSYSPLTPIRSIGNLVYENNINGNDDGIQAIGAIDNQFWGNNVTANSRFGVLLVSSSFNIFWGNRFSINRWGMGFENSSRNAIYSNNFVNNTSHVYTDASSNTWNSTYPIGGNFWSDSLALDSGMDGIVDLPYVIQRDNVDNHPLAGTFLNHLILWQNGTYHIITVCNSSERIFSFFSLENKVSLNFTGPMQTAGFCRISIQKELAQSLWRDNITLLVNGMCPSNMRMWEDSSSVYIYFVYPHPNSQALVITEFSYSVFLTLLLSLLLVATFVAKRTMILDSTQTQECAY